MTWQIENSTAGLSEFPVIFAAPAAATYTLLLATVQGKIIDSIRVKTDSGTATFALKINSTAISGLSAITATPTKTAYSATSGNVMAVDDDLKIEFTAVSSPVNFSMTIAFS
jgi:hypothetical protein